MAAASAIQVMLPAVGDELPFSPDLIAAKNSGVSSEDRVKWLLRRRQGLGCSEMPAILNRDDYNSRYKIWCDKRGLIPLDTVKSDSAELGLQMEPYLLHRFSLVHTREIVANRNVFRSERYPWLQGTPDGFDISEPTIVTPTQVKLSGRKGWEEDEIPSYVYTQVQSEMLLLGAPRAIVIAMLGGSFGPIAAKEYALEADEEHQAQIVAAGEEFWARVQENRPPEPDGSKATGDAIAMRWPQHVEGRSGFVYLSEEIQELVRELNQLQDLQKRTELRIEQIRQIIKDQMGDNEYAVLPDHSAAFSFKTVTRKEKTVTYPETSYRSLRSVKVRKH